MCSHTMVTGVSISTQCYDTGEFNDVNEGPHHMICTYVMVVGWVELTNGSISTELC